MKAISPKINDSTAEFYPGLFRSLNGGAVYALEAFPTLYRRTLHEMKGMFAKEELSLTIDVFNSTALTPGMAGQHIDAQVEDGIDLDHLDKKWDVDRDKILWTLHARTAFQKACLEIWANGFWYQEKAETFRESGEFEAWLAQLI